jgi:hypothetical protein
MGVMDAYCERVGPGLFAEPLNAVTNLSFIFAAWAAWILAKRTNTLTTGIKVLIAIAVSVGIGSILWHTLPNSWTLILDIVPIVIFIMYYIWLYTRSVTGKSILFASLSVIAFLVALYFAFPYSNVLHGAPVYTPGLLVVFLLGIYHGLMQKTARFLLLSTAGVYFTALFFRTIDQEICHFMPIGTHFIWHSLIGLVTYMAMRALILNLTPKATHEEKTAKGRPQ